MIADNLFTVFTRGEYFEKHHILPRSIYPEYVKDESNIVNLSAKDHFMAHYLLLRYYDSQPGYENEARKMGYALTQMAQRSMKNTSDTDAAEMAALYEKAMLIRHALGCSEETKRKIGDANRGHKLTDEQKAARRVRRQELRYKYCGRHIKWTDEQKRMQSERKRGNSFWFNNGVVQVRASQCPAGFKSGRLKSERIKKKRDGSPNKGRIAVTDGISNMYIPRDQPIPDGWRCGITVKNVSLSPIHNKGKHCITDGQINKFISADEKIPIGFRLGRAKTEKHGIRPSYVVCIIDKTTGYISTYSSPKAAADVTGHSVQMIRHFCRTMRLAQNSIWIIYEKDLDVWRSRI